MEKTTLGRTGLRVSRTAFGALPIQRIDKSEASVLLRKAYERGINFFDTARAYTDSEEKIGVALSRVRNKIVIATKSGATNGKSLRQNVQTSLGALQTDYIDILQLHNPAFMPVPDGADGLYSTLQELQERGYIRFLGFTNHRLDLALKAVQSGLFDTVQFPLSSLSSTADLQLIRECHNHNIGLIAMKAMSGGLIRDARTTFAFLRQYENVVPIWGIQRQAELEQFLQLETSPPSLDSAMWQQIEQDRKELSGAFCRGCGYCLPCPVDIPIPTAARMRLLLSRAPVSNFVRPEFYRQMKKIADCIRCGHCSSLCPYGLDTPKLLQEELEYYQQFAKEFSAQTNIVLE